MLGQLVEDEDEAGRNSGQAQEDGSPRRRAHGSRRLRAMRGLWHGSKPIGWTRKRPGTRVPGRFWRSAVELRRGQRDFSIGVVFESSLSCASMYAFRRER